MWGVDGYERQHIARKDDRVIILCAIPGNSALSCIWDLEDQDENDKIKQRTPRATQTAKETGAKED